MDPTTHLHSACYFGKLEMAREALDQGAGSNAENIRGETPLHLVSRGQYDSQGGGVGIVQLLLGRGANINVQDKGHMTPLHLACYYGKLEIVRALLSHGASVNTKGELGQTVLHLVLDGNRSGTDGVRIARLLLEHGADVNANDSDHDTPLHLASNYGEFAIGRVLLIHGANPNAANIWGQTPLHMLSLRPYIGDKSRLVGILVDGGANVDARDKDHDTPLHTAYYTNRLDIKECLLKRGADDGAKNRKGEIPIQLAPQWQLMMEHLRQTMQR
ncbi:Ankyrin repeat-containing domain protein [Lactarius tabidus]